VSVGRALASYTGPLTARALSTETKRPEMTNPVDRTADWCMGPKRRAISGSPMQQFLDSSIMGANGRPGYQESRRYSNDEKVPLYCQGDGLVAGIVGELDWQQSSKNTEIVQDARLALRAFSATEPTTYELGECPRTGPTVRGFDSVDRAANATRRHNTCHVADVHPLPSARLSVEILTDVVSKQPSEYSSVERHDSHSGSGSIVSDCPVTAVSDDTATVEALISDDTKDTDSAVIAHRYSQILATADSSVVMGSPITSTQVTAHNHHTTATPDSNLDLASGLQRSVQGATADETDIQRGNASVDPSLLGSVSTASIRPFDAVESAVESVLIPSGNTEFEREDVPREQRAACTKISAARSPVFLPRACFVVDRDSAGHRSSHKPAESLDCATYGRPPHACVSFGFGGRLAEVAAACSAPLRTVRSHSSTSHKRMNVRRLNASVLCLCTDIVPEFGTEYPITSALVRTPQGSSASTTWCVVEDTMHTQSLLKKRNFMTYVSAVHEAYIASQAEECDLDLYKAGALVFWSRLRRLLHEVASSDGTSTGVVHYVNDVAGSATESTEATHLQLWSDLDYGSLEIVATLTNGNKASSHSATSTIHPEELNHGLTVEALTAKGDVVAAARAAEEAGMWPLAMVLASTLDDGGEQFRVLATRYTHNCIHMSSAVFARARLLAMRIDDFCSPAVDQPHDSNSRSRRYVADYCNSAADRWRTVTAASVSGARVCSTIDAPVSTLRGVLTGSSSGMTELSYRWRYVLAASARQQNPEARRQMSIDLGNRLLRCCGDAAVLAAHACYLVADVDLVLRLAIDLPRCLIGISADASRPPPSAISAAIRRADILVHVAYLSRMQSCTANSNPEPQQTVDDKQPAGRPATLYLAQAHYLADIGDLAGDFCRDALVCCRPVFR